VVHCYLSNLIEKKGQGWYWFQQVLKSDIYDTQGGTTPEGIHAGVMGGSVDMVMRGFCGVRPFENRIRINPNPPKKLTKIKYNFYYQGYQVFIALEGSRIKIYIKGRKSKFCAVPVEVSGKLYNLCVGRKYRLPFKKRRKEIPAKKRKKMAYKRILIVDGDTSSAAVLETQLEDKGFLVQRAIQGTEALQILKSEWINLIIISVNLSGGMTGFQLFKEIKKAKYFSDIPIVIYSSKEGMKNTFKKLGAEDFVSKKKEVKFLVNSVQKILKNNGRR
jgi:CheY-like chemotaxis protein